MRTLKRESRKEKRGTFAAGTLAACFLISLFYFLLAGSLPAQAPPATADSHPVVEGYYKIAPGKTDEWLEIFKAHHLPILKERRRQGQILDITIYRPFLHQGGPPWDFKVLLRYRDFAALGDRATTDAIERRLYPDGDAHKQAEQRRWEITAAHWDDIMVAEPTD